MENDKSYGSGSWWPRQKQDNDGWPRLRAIDCFLTSVMLLMLAVAFGLNVAEFMGMDFPRRPLQPEEVRPRAVTFFLLCVYALRMANIFMVHFLRIVLKRTPDDE